MKEMMKKSKSQKGINLLLKCQFVRKGGRYLSGTWILDTLIIIISSSSSSMRILEYQSFQKRSAVHMFFFSFYPGLFKLSSECCMTAMPIAHDEGQGVPTQ